LEESGYVWVFAGMDGALFMYRPTREADFLHDFLRGFEGVLVSDFYSGYDSIEVPQQKCLVHLMRDLNDLILKCPFDGELNQLARDLGKVMRAVVETIDRFGLRSRYLRKHKKDVEAFLESVQSRESESEVAQKFRERLVKCREKLFVFLDHDNVPWNNNAAEHGIKYFAKYRRLVSGRISEVGLKDYLALQSIYRTCDRRGIRFLEFLLSGEKRLSRFAQRR